MAAIQLTRLPDWEKQLVDLCNERRKTPYVYGKTDCASFAQATVKAITGVVLLPDIERPTSLMASARFLISRGWRDVEDMVTALLGEPVSPKESRRGDIVSFEAMGDYHLGARVGDVVLSPDKEGLVIIASVRWHKAWMVG